MTEKGIVSKSRLLVQRATGNDAGLYTCGPNNAPPGTTRVHVLSGKFMTKILFDDFDITRNTLVTVRHRV